MELFAEIEEWNIGGIRKEGIMATGRNNGCILLRKFLAVIDMRGE